MKQRKKERHLGRAPPAGCKDCKREERDVRVNDNIMIECVRVYGKL